jgi:hypothetical protein
MTGLPALTQQQIEALQVRVRERMAARRANAGRHVTPAPAPCDAVFAAGVRWLATVGYAPEEWEEPSQG